MDIQEAKKAFEDWVKNISGLNSDFEIGCNGQYKSDVIYFAWSAWQAAQTMPEGFFLVPKVFPEEKALNLAKQKIEEASKRNSEKYRIGEFSEDSKAFIIRNELGAMKNLHRDFSRMAEELEQKG